MSNPEFKLIVAGGRDFTDGELLSRIIFSIADVEFADKDISIVSGMARGADALAYQFAHKNHVTCYEFPAQWDRYGKKAGYMRNTKMASFADGLLAFYSGSNGTGHMIQCMQALGKPVLIIDYKGLPYGHDSPNSEAGTE